VTTVEDLVQWLRAQLDEDERIARAASDGPWAAYRGPEKTWQSKGDLIHPVRTWDHKLGDPVIMAAYWADSRHIAEWDPQRVLREIDAKRQMLTAYAQVAANDVNEVEYAHGYANALGEAVRLLALPYADRPGYREEWAP
jgi:hypothetical protein